ncbi:MAG: fatty acid desaturase [Candidatus Omnitrophica bacterium]|nr:fatty acid desaturase [Candidatus Omnitrophota bacterium]
MARRSRFTTFDDWVLLVWMIFMHVGALAGFFTFSWQALGVCLFLWWLTGGIGICLGYHRYFTHRSYETPKFMQYILAVCGSLAGEAGPISWVAAHRYHHTYSDQEEDPHSPNRGFWWAHMTWLFGREKFLAEFESCKRFTPDMARDKFLVFLNRNHMLPALFLAILLYVWGGWSFVVWGMFVRSVLVYHSTWLVNSASHIWGYRSFKTTDQSRNNWWVAFLTFGEGWHNNHHAFQRSARHGLRWWEVDMTYLTIRLMSMVGLARQVHLPVPSSASGATLPTTDFKVPALKAAKQ